jgi:hypothetical protein
MALSASEMHRLGKGAGCLSRRDDADPGLHYYGLALKGLFVVLSNLGNSSYSLESVLSVLYFLIIYESKFGAPVSNLQLHIDGVRSYLASHFYDRRHFR